MDTSSPQIDDKINKASSQSQATTNGDGNLGAGSLSDSVASTDGYKTPNNNDSLSKTNLYIRGLNSNTCDQDLYEMCRDFGQISSTKAILDKATGCCRGYGFVEFTEPRSAELAVQELTKVGVQAQMARISPPYLSHHHNQHHHNHQHHHHNHHHNFNHTNHVQNSSNHSNNHGGNNNGCYGGNNGSSNNSGHQHNHHPSNNNHHADPTNLYIANLPPNMSEQELENLLSIYGPVVSTRILRDQSNIPRGVGFARMESRDKCEQIIKQLNGRSCEGCKEPLLVKFADGGNKKRHQGNHQHHHLHQNQHQNNSQHQHHKVHLEDSRWRDNNNTSDLGSVSSFDHQNNTSHSNHLPDLAMICPVGYPRMQPGFPSNVATGASYPAPLVPPSSAPQWIHPGGPGQPYVIPQQMIQPGGLGPSSQAAALHYGHIPQLTSQMQGLQIAHPGAPVGGYLPPQHQWSPLWSHPIAQQPQSSIRLPLPMQQPPPPILPSQQQLPHSQQQQQPQPQQPPPQPQQPQQSQQQQQQQQPTSPQPSTMMQQPQAINDTKLQVNSAS